MSRDLTNEKLKDKFKSNFDLANFGIKLAVRKIEEGESVSLNQMMERLAQSTPEEIEEYLQQLA